MTELYTLIRDVVYTNTKINEDIQTFRPQLEWVMDFRKVALQERFLKLVAEEFESRVLTHYSVPIQIAGMEAGALPLLAALQLLFPQKIKNSFYFRKSRNRNDLTKQLEGEYQTDVPLVLVDDVLNSGSTVLKQLALVKNFQGEVAEIFTVIHFRGAEYYTELFGEKIRVTTVFTLDDFKADLGLQTFVLEKDTIAASFAVYGPTWKAFLGKANHYDVFPKSAPVADKTCIYQGTDEGYIVAIDKKTGDIAWRFKTHFTAGQKGIYSSPVLYRDSLFLGAYDGNVYCLNKKTGEVRWVSFEGDYIGSSPVVASNLGYVFIGLEFGLIFKQGGVIALDATTGKVIWVDRKISGYVHASPEYSAKYNMVVCGSNNGVLYAFDAKSGKRLWKFATKGEIKYRPVFDEERGVVAVGSFDGGLYVLRVHDGSLIHRFAARSGFYSTPVVYKNLLIAGSLDKCIYAYNLDTKDVEWSVETNGRIFASPVLAEGLVYIGSNDGCLYVLDAITGERPAHIQLTERIINSVVVEGDTLYIPTHACELYRYDKRKDTTP